MKKNNESFEYLITKLDKIVSDLEKNEINIEDAMLKYEEGIKLYKKCYDIIKDAELKVSILNKEFENEDKH